MTFRIALSGLNAASADLNATANNIANANTTGFKSSRTQFGDFFPVNSYGLANSAVGGGVRLNEVAQQFSQGNVDVTGNTLDLAISGDGFFTLSDNGTRVYTRAGAFGTNNQGYVVNSAGQRLQVYPPQANGTTFSTGQLTDLRLSTSDNPPRPSSSLEVGVNLPANAAVPGTAPFSAADGSSYNATTSITIYDSLGATHSADAYFVKTANQNEWEMHTVVDGNAVGLPTTLTFSGSGALVTPATAITLPAYATTNGSSPLVLSLDLGASTQYGDSFNVNNLAQDGYATGRMSGLEITDTGVVQARYTNGQSTPLGQLAIAKFSSAQGLQQLGNTSWGETFDSGAAMLGQAGSGSLGQIHSGSLEASNVDLTEQLVNMITAQRNFQANAQMISTADQITQTVINIR
ncbi:MAG: flagellar hook protein FlgE [Panacagrimonas sp.]